MPITRKELINQANPNAIDAEFNRMRDTTAAEVGLGDMLHSMAPASKTTAPITVSGWDEGIAVATDTVTLATAGMVIAVEATTAGSVTGPKSMITTTPATLEAQVLYDATGIPTLNFFATDDVTEIAVLQMKVPVSLRTGLDTNIS